jgi:stigma-specific protein Stig1
MSLRSTAWLAFVLAVGGCGQHAAMKTAPADMAAAACSHCAAPDFCCNNKCIDVTTNNANCGGCGNTCSGGTACMGGTCLCPGSNSKCDATQTCCGQTGCKNVMTDAQNCGSCGQACADGETCEGGACKAAPGCMGCMNTCCAGQCTDTSSDASNCGMCGNACPRGQTCSGGTCMGGMMGPDDGGSCSCSKKCAIACVGHDCCDVDALAGKCKADPACIFKG